MAINDGDIPMASEVLRQLHRRANADKAKSLASFLEGSKPLFKALSANEMFTSNFAGIDYPGFKLQLPTSILGSLLALGVRQENYEFARHLIYTEDIDGPDIPEALYKDPFIAGPLIELAAKTYDQPLLVKLMGISSAHTRPTVLDLHVDAMHWQSAARVLQDLENDTQDWNVYTLANLASKIIFLQSARFKDTGLDRDANLKAAHAMFRSVYQKYSQASNRNFRKAQSLLTIFSTVDKSSADFCSTLVPDRPAFHDFSCPPIAFNRIMNAVLAVHGSAAGRRVLQSVWPDWARQYTNIKNMGGRNLPLAEQRMLVDAANGQRWVVYGWLQPNAQAILSILEQALVDFKSLDSESRTKAPSSSGENPPKSPSKTETAQTSDSDLNAAKLEFLTWALEAIRDVTPPRNFHDAVDRVDEILIKHEDEGLREALPELARQVVEGTTEVGSGPKVDLIWRPLGQRPQKMDEGYSWRVLREPGRVDGR
jgi:hypothetical protein